MVEKDLKCNNCTYETVENDESIEKDHTWHACWLDAKNGKCKITGYFQEGTLLYKK